MKKWAGFNQTNTYWILLKSTFFLLFFVLGWETHEVKLQCILLYYVPRKKFLDIFQICWLDLENPPDLIKSSIYNRWEAISPHTNDLSKNYNLQFEFWWSFYTERWSEVVRKVEHFQEEIVFSSWRKNCLNFPRTVGARK